jgi:hypothetical protein
MAIGKEIEKKWMVLHRKEEQLRTKEEQLREKEKDLRWEKQRLYDLELHNLVLRSNTASELKTHHSKLCDCKYLLA